MPYSNPSSPAAVETVSSKPSSAFSFSQRAVDHSQSRATTSSSPSSSSHYFSPATPGSASSATSPWSMPRAGPMPTVPRRSSSGGPAPRPSGALSPSRTGSGHLPRLDKSPSPVPPTQGVDSLGLSVDSPASSSSTYRPSPASAKMLASDGSSQLTFPTSSSSSSAASIPRRPSPTAAASAALTRAGSPSLRVDIPPPLKATSHPIHHTRHHSQGSLRPTSTMIRKKSGEVVRPSLKSRRSSSTPNSAGVADGSNNSQFDDDEDEEDARGSWDKYCKSEPATPSGERKTLRFAGGADDEEGELEKVVLFRREHKVTAVTRVLEGEDVDRMGTDTETENEAGGGAHRFGGIWASPRYNPPSSSSSSSGSKSPEKIEILHPGSTKVPRIQGLNLTAGTPRPLLVPEYDMVVLETLGLVDAGGNGALTLKGTVVVKNITFGKWVAVRFTFDSWQTVSEVSAVHTVHIPAASLQPCRGAGDGWDRFTFTIRLDDVRRKIDERELLLAIRYSIDGGADWWDACDGDNYRVKFRRVKPASPPSSEVAKKVPAVQQATTTEARGTTRAEIEAGNAFLPLLEASRSPVKAQSMLPPANTHALLPNRFSAPQQRTSSPRSSSPPKKPTPSPRASDWTFPIVPLVAPPSHQQPLMPPTPPDSAASSTLSTPTDFLSSLPGSETSTPTSKYGGYGVPASPPASPPRATDVGFDSLESRFSSNETSGGGGISPEKKSATRGGEAGGTVVDLPSPPSSASHSPPSPSMSPLPQTPAELALSPAFQSYDLPDLKMEASKRTSEPTSYQDFIDRYCFFRGDNSSSPPSSVSASPQHTSLPLPHHFTNSSSSSSPYGRRNSATPPSSGSSTPQVLRPDQFSAFALPSHGAWAVPSLTSGRGSSSGSPSQATTPTMGGSSPVGGGSPVGRAGGYFGLESRKAIA